jgi:hypothetical protein
MLGSISKDLFTQAFDTKIKKKPFEQFSLLLCDLENCEEIQKNLLKNILFGDESSPLGWLDYINYLINQFPNRKMQLQRLVNKAIDCIDEDKHRMSKHLLSLHMISASLKRLANVYLIYFLLKILNFTVKKWRH